MLKSPKKCRSANAAMSEIVAHPTFSYSMSASRTQKWTTRSAQNQKVPTANRVSSMSLPPRLSPMCRASGVWGCRRHAERRSCEGTARRVARTSEKSTARRRGPSLLEEGEVHLVRRVVVRLDDDIDGL